MNGTTLQRNGASIYVDVGPSEIRIDVDPNGGVDGCKALTGGIMERKGKWLVRWGVA